MCTLAVLLSCSCAYGAPVSASYTSWMWGDPTPQGDALSDVTFVGLRGYAVGEEGTVLRTDDGGSTWSGLASGTRQDLSRVQALDASTVLIAGLCTLRESTDAGASFQALPVDQNCQNGVDSFWFFNATTGFLERRDGTVLFTHDGGQTLEVKTPVPQAGEPPGELYFLSAGTGFALANGSHSGRIMRTTDGAGSWTQVASTTAPLSDITFVTPALAYAVGEKDTLLQSTDEGKSWHSLPLALPPGTLPNLSGIACSDVENCVIATGDTTLVHTSDGGLTGSLVSPSGLRLSAVAFSTGANALAVGVGGETALSSDGGASFPNRATRSIDSVELSSSIRVGPSVLDAFIPGRKGIAATTDGGASWSVLRVPTSDPIVDVTFPAGETGYAVDGSGTVFRTSTAGRTWSIASSNDLTPVALLAPNPNVLLLAGERGLLRSRDGGRSFGAVRGTIVVKRRHKRRKVRLSNVSLFGAQLAGGAMFAYGEDLLRSTDSGGRWRLIPRPLPVHRVEAVSFVSATTGYEICGGRLFFTHDGGVHWRQIVSVPTTDIGEGSEIAFSSAADGYVLGTFPREEERLLFRTEDGGRTWAPEELTDVSAVAAAGAVDYAIGRGLFWTRSGGILQNRPKIALSVSGPHKLSERRLRSARGRVHVSGHLEPASGGEQVMISWLQGPYWETESTTVSATGHFALTVREISQTTYFIAQWSGNGIVSGAGSPAVRLTVTHRKLTHR